MNATDVRNQLKIAIENATSQGIEIYIGTSTCSGDICCENVKIQVKKKYQVTDHIATYQEALKEVVVISDKDFKGEYYAYPMSQIKKDFES